MSTLTDFRLNATKILGTDSTAAGSDEVLVDFYANEAVREILLATRCYVSIATSTPGANQDLTLDASILDIITMFFTVSGTQYSLQKRPIDEIVEMRRNSANASPSLFYAVAGASLLMFYPTPGATDTLTVYYVAKPTAMSAGTHDPSSATYGGIPTEQHHLIESYVCWKVGDAIDDASSQNGLTYKQEYTQGVGQFRRDLAKRGGNELAPIPLPSRRRGRSYIPRPDQVNVWPN